MLLSGNDSSKAGPRGLRRATARRRHLPRRNLGFRDGGLRDTL